MAIDLSQHHSANPMIVGSNCAAVSIDSIHWTKRSMITKSNLVVVALLQVALWDATDAAEKKSDECGLASVYSTVSEETASGEDTRAEDFTAAHRTLPFGTVVHVNNQDNGRSAVVRITDRGPFVSGRTIDVSQIAARELGISGLAKVCLHILVLRDD